MSDDYPHVSSFLDRHGKRRWRYRRNGKTISLPSEPGQAGFEAAYSAALSGQNIARAEVRRLFRAQGS